MPKDYIRLSIEFDPHYAEDGISSLVELDGHLKDMGRYCESVLVHGVKRGTDGISAQVYLLECDIEMIYEALGELESRPYVNKMDHWFLSGFDLFAVEEINMKKIGFDSLLAAVNPDYGPDCLSPPIIDEPRQEDIYDLTEIGPGEMHVSPKAEQNPQETDIPSKRSPISEYPCTLNFELYLGDRFLYKGKIPHFPFHINKKGVPGAARNYLDAVFSAGIHPDISSFEDKKRANGDFTGALEKATMMKVRPADNRNFKPVRIELEERDGRKQTKPKETRGKKK